MACDLCGKSGSTVLAKVEGVAYRVCEACSRYGEVVREQRAPVKRQARRVDERVVRGDAGAVLRKARERLGKRQDEFAKFLQVKESELHAWETGHRLPTVETASELERRLDIELMQSPSQGDEYYSSSGDSSGITIGDLLKKK